MLNKLTLSELLTLTRLLFFAPDGPIPRTQVFSPPHAVDPSMYDVAWCPSGGHVAASLSNGGVAIWDLQHLPSSLAGQGLQGADVRGEDTGKIIGTHERSVNRLSWNPFHHNMLLSGSQVS